MDDAPVACEAFLVVSSEAESAQVKQLLGVEPSESRTLRHPLHGVFLTEWSFRLSGSDRAQDAVDEATVNLLALPEQLAATLKRIGVGRHASVTLLVVQRMTDDPATKGLTLSPALLAWLNVAGAGIAIDQYAF